MNKLILINGKGGSGKTTTAEQVFQLLEHAALVDIDDLMRVKPWEFNKQLAGLGITNATTMINNFFTAKYKYVILSGGIYTQALLDQLIKKLKASCHISFIWLTADKKIRDKRRLKRGRDAADSSEHFDTIDSLFQDVASLKMQSGSFTSIDTTKLSAKETAKRIISIVYEK